MLKGSWPVEQAAYQITSCFSLARFGTISVISCLSVSKGFVSRKKDVS